jgi:CRISPR-associated protein Csy3
MLMAKKAAPSASGMKKSGKFILPANLSFRRSIDVSDGLMYSVMKDGKRRPVIVEQVTVRGAMGNSTAGYDKQGNALAGEALEKAQNPTKPNIQSIDRAALDASSDTLELSFSLAFHGGGNAPDACSKADYRDAMTGFVEIAREQGLYEDLAARYLWNIVNGRVLWRNGYGIPGGCTLRVDGGEFSFDWGKLRKRERFPGLDALAMACSSTTENVSGLVHKIGAALAGKSDLLAIDVAIRVRSYKGAEVWPSQEFVEETQKRRNGREISRVLAARESRVDGASIRYGYMHSQKIGNAVRTVDEWHGNAVFGAIPVEAFGWVQSELAALRAPVNPDAGLDAYRSLETVGLTASALKANDPGAHDQALYTLAMIVRGGVFGVSEKEAPESSTSVKDATELSDGV